MKLTLAAVGTALLLPLLAGPLGAPGAAFAETGHVSISARVTCTKTSTGTCIRGGGFCPQASFNRAGYDAVGRRYVCKGDRVHPHWMK